MLYLDLFRASVIKMCPRISEKPKTGHFLGSGMLKKFSMYINANCLITLQKVS